MRIRAILSTGVFVLSASTTVGCGIIRKDLDPNVNFGFTIEAQDAEYHDIVQFDPNSDPDFQKNRSKIKEGSVVEIVVNFEQVFPDNRAKVVAGQVDLRKHGAGEDAWIPAIGSWSGIPLYDENGLALQGQRTKLDLTPGMRDDISRLVFDATDPIDFRISGYGLDDALMPKGPVHIAGEVEVSLHVTVGLP